MLGILIINAIFSIIFPIGKLAMVYAGPFLTIAFRMFLGGMLLLGYRYLVPDTQKHYMNPHFWRDVILLALFNVFLTNGCEFWGLRFMSSAKTSFIYNLSPFFSALFGYYYFDERMTSKKWIGLLISFIGFIPIFVMQSPQETPLHHFFIFSTAEIALLVATISLTYGWIVMQDVVRNKKFDVVLANGCSMILGGIFSGITGIFLQEHLPISTEWVYFSLWILLMALLSSCICYPLYAHLLKKYTATFMTFTGLLGPLLAAFFDWAFFGYVVSSEFYLATIIVCIGLYIFYQEELRQGYLITG